MWYDKDPDENGTGNGQPFGSNTAPPVVPVDNNIGRLIGGVLSGDMTKRVRSNKGDSLYRAAAVKINPETTNGNRKYILFKDITSHLPSKKLSEAHLEEITYALEKAQIGVQDAADLWANIYSGKDSRLGWLLGSKPYVAFLSSLAPTLVNIDSPENKIPHAPFSREEILKIMVEAGYDPAKAKADLDDEIRLRLNK